MSDETLKKIYYKSPEVYEETYAARFHSPFAFHLGLDIQQYHRQKAFPAFFYYNKDFALLTEKVYAAYERFVQLVEHLPPVVLQQFALLCIVDEVKSTNDIEGVHSTRKEIRDILDGTVGKSDRLESIVSEYKGLSEDVKFSFETLADIRHFYDEFAQKEIVAENSAHALDGKLFRKDPVDIESASGKVIHRGLFPEMKILEAMDVTLGILHSADYPLLVRLAIFHYLFAYIHPFYDGNGRTDRFITSYFLKQGFHTLVALRLSAYIKHNRSMYYRLFEEADSEINRGDLTPFILGFLQMIQGTIEDTIRLLTRKNEQLKRYEEKIKTLCGKDELLEKMYFILLQAALFYGNGVTISDLVTMTGKVRNTIQKRIDAMPKAHVLAEKKGRTFYYKLDLRILK